eukprot:TRINITY_DN14169_c0_g3_i1.p3 TRINITY_DN14169_c0_g3~~TRINITY_DN14169_c0_g3_i1.p3  ORF type:complete len:110 (-),score=0.43 TRINITY_DN14169_c0_g3_i1:832-1161(-)
MLEDRFVKEYFNAYIYRKYTYPRQRQAPREKETYFLGLVGGESPIHKTNICVGLFAFKNYQNNLQYTNEIYMHMVSPFSVRQEIFCPQNSPLYIQGTKQACTIKVYLLL